MIFIEWTGAALAIVGAMIMASNVGWARHAWRCWIASSLALIIVAAEHHLFGFLLMQLAFLVINVAGFRRAGVGPRFRRVNACCDLRIRHRTSSKLCLRDDE
jgi:hypothetical protein